MKKIAKLFSIMVVLAIVITALPKTISNADNVSVDEIIFAADPSKLGTTGTAATPTDITDGSWKNNGGLITEAYTGISGETPTYTWSHTFSGTGLKYPRSVINTGYSSEQIGWINDADVLNALAGKIKVSVKVRVSGDNLPTSGYNTTIRVYPINKTTTLSSVWSTGDIIKFTDTVGKADGFKTLTATPTLALKPFDSGYMFFESTIKIDNVSAPITWEMSDIQFTINTDDKDAINAALIAADSDWTYDSIVAAYSNRDYVSVDEIIFAGEPSKLGQSGTAATPTDIGDTSYNNNGGLITEAYTGVDGEKATYTFSHTFDSTGVKWPRTAIDLGNSSEKMAWINDAAVLNALAGKITISMKARISGADLPTSGYNSTIRIYTFDKDTKRADIWNDLFKFEDTIGKADGWKTLTITPSAALKPFASGYMLIEASIKTDNVKQPVVWEFADIQFTINTDDKAAIDAALAAADSEWTYDAIVASYANRDVVIKPADGNMNDDEKIDILDVVILAGKLKESAEITDVKLVDVADVSGDGKVTVDDLALIRKTRLLSL